MNTLSGKILLAAVALLALLLGLWVGWEKPVSEPPLMQDRFMTLFPHARPLVPFTLERAGGGTFTAESLKGKIDIVFFGYTACPDVCPTTLQMLSQAYTQLRKQGKEKDIRIVFVSVDPGRDRTDRLKKYVEYFEKDFVGVTGDADQIAALAKQLGAAYEVLDKQRNAAGDYPVNHTGALFVINSNAAYIAVMTPPFEAGALASRFALLKQLEGKVR